MPMRIWTGSERVGQMPKPRPRQFCTSSLSRPASDSGRSSTTRLVMFELTLQPIALTASRSTASCRAYSSARRATVSSSVIRSASWKAATA